MRNEFGPRWLKAHGAYIVYLFISFFRQISPSLSHLPHHLRLPHHLYLIYISISSLIQNVGAHRLLTLRSPNNLCLLGGNGNTSTKSRRQNQKINNSRPPVSQINTQQKYFPDPPPLFIIVLYLCKSEHFLTKCIDWFLKGVWHEIFDFRFFLWISVPQAPKYSIGAVLNFFENSRRYSRMNIYRRCRWHRRLILVTGK